MKIALCLSGQPRGLAKAHEYVKTNLLDKNDVDVFCHTWDDGSIIESLYTPLSIEVAKSSEHKLTKDYNVKSSRHPAINTVSFYYSLYRANRLCIQSGNSYDVVIRSRYDYAIATQIDFSSMDLNMLWTPLVHQRSFLGPNFLCTDQFAFSCPRIMNIYCDVYNNLDHYHDTGTVMNGEDMLARHIREVGVSDRVSYIDMKDPFFDEGKYGYGPHSLVRDDMENWIVR